jgi:large repetitive protein
MKRFRPLLVSVLLAVALLTLLALSLTAATSSSTPAAQAQLRINEFMADNQFTLEDPDEPGEYPDWIELYNPGPGAVSLNDLYWSDDPERPNRFAITDGLTIPAGGFLLFYADNDSRQGAYHLNFALGRDGGFISLFSGATDRVIDSRSYGPQLTDVSLGRQVDGGPNWRTFDTPTPRATNALLPPKVANVQQTPLQPTAEQTVTISANVSDERGVSTVTLFYSITGQSLAQVPMIGNAGVYSAQIPPFPDDTLVRYYVVATDIDNLTGRSPLAGPQRPYRYVVGFQAPVLYINEIMADNNGAVPNPDRADDFPDWIELFNPGPAAIPLDGLFLSDDPDEPTKFLIPAMEIPAGGFLVFYASGEPELGPLHTNFRLDKNGETVGLYGASGQIKIDEYRFPELSENGSIGRYPDGESQWVQTACYSPGAANDPCDVQAILPLITN